MLKNITFALFFQNTEINIIHYMILEKIDKLLPLAKKYGAMFVLLPLSEKGLPKDLNEKIDNEIERSTIKDTELEGAINVLEEKIEKNTQDIQELNEHLTQTDANIATVNENLVTAINSINQNMADGFNTINSAIEAERQIRAEKDTELENAINTEKEERIADVQALQEEDVRINEKIDALDEKVDNVEQDLNDKIEQEKTDRETKDAEIEAQLLTQEGTEFNKNTGILTLKSKGGTNDVQVQFNFNFGTF